MLLTVNAKLVDSCYKLLMHLNTPHNTRLLAGTTIVVTTRSLRQHIQTDTPHQAVVKLVRMSLVGTLKKCHGEDRALSLFREHIVSSRCVGIPV